MTEPQSFEKAYTRLEQILEKMNSGTVSLEESLSLYEEADKLISSCSKKLDAAEKRIQTLVKNREGEIQYNEDGSLAVEDFRSE